MKHVEEGLADRSTPLPCVGNRTSCELAAEGPTDQQQGRVCTWLLELPSVLRSASLTGSIRPLSDSGILVPPRSHSNMWL